MASYIEFATAEEARRFEEACAKLGYPVVNGWPNRFGNFDDPQIPDRMPVELVNKARKFAKLGVMESDLPDQHPEFKYLRVKKA